MIEHPFMTDLGLAEKQVLRGVVTATVDENQFVVRLGSGDDDRLIVADLVVASQNPVSIQPGDAVLCLLDGENFGRGYILGALGTRPPTQAINTEPVESAPPLAPAPTADVPDTLVLEAKQSMTLRVGEGSITIRADGKILIKGKDLVSHAKRTNRIKGGSVSIN